jgi:transglutaminase-like putative cysteine protease
MNDIDFSLLQQVVFIDHHTVNWSNVRRTRSLFYQRFNYEYPGPIRNLKQRLVVVPADRYGAQRLHNHALAVNPLPIATREALDRFGNRVLELEVQQVDSAVSFEVVMIMESDVQVLHSPPVSPASINYFLQPTRLTMPDDAVHAVSRMLQRDAPTPDSLAQRINDWVYGAMRYKTGVTTVETTAAEALSLGEGLCQDYAHLMLSICRTSGLPARYVSGHLLGEGGSHAWVEVLLPTGDGVNIHAFDPTNNRRPHLGYITVAVGRDYRDVSPTSGSFTAPYGGQLTCSKRAGLTFVEYLNGDSISAQAPI